MDPVRNPFAPGAGNPPPELAGRASVLEDVRIALQRIAIGRSAQSSILVGLRGVGKTVLLVRIEGMAEGLGFKTCLVEAHEAKSLPELIVPGLRSILLSLSAVEAGKTAARQGLRVLKSFLGGLKASIGDLELALGVDPATGSADSGDLEVDLPSLFVAVGEAARAAGRPVALLIDELQYLTEKEFGALIMSIHASPSSSNPFLNACRVASLEPMRPLTPWPSK